LKTKFIQLTDTATDMACLVLQFEASDAWCRAGRFGAGLKVVLQFRGRMVTCFAGYDLRDDAGETIEELSTKMSVDGTILAFKELLHFVEDIHLLPDVLDVELFRHTRGLLRHRLFISNDLREILDEEETTSLRKVLYGFGRMTHLALVNVNSKDVLVDMGSTSREHLTAEYLWLPVDTATDDELSSINLCPLKYERL
jgi:hypothetical protein